MVGPSRPKGRRVLASLPANVLFVGQRGCVPQRGRAYSDESVRGHPGKMLPDLARALIEFYTRPGDLVLDPMSGIGNTGVEAVRLGRRYVGVELEPRFAAWQEANLRASGVSAGFRVLCGDARRIMPEGCAGGVPVPEADAVITSPPYGDCQREQKNPSRALWELMAAGRFGRNVLSGTCGREAGKLGNVSNSAYLREMASVWRACFGALRPGSILAVVVQPERTRRELVPLHHETARLCADAGFVFLDELVAVLGRVVAPAGGPARLTAHASFWRRLTAAQLRAAGLPVTLGQVAHVLVFRKPDSDAPAGAPLPREPSPGHRKGGRRAALAAPARSPGLP